MNTNVNLTRLVFDLGLSVVHFGPAFPQVQHHTIQAPSLCHSQVSLAPHWLLVASKKEWELFL